MSSAKKLQEKLFSSPALGNGSPRLGSDIASVNPGLSINVPRPQLQHSNQASLEGAALPKTLLKQPLIDSLPKILTNGNADKTSTSPSTPPKANGDDASEEYQTYRDTLIAKLGAQYEGVERYRLVQDSKRERHWKRWGPYLSERQWVSLYADGP